MTVHELFRRWVSDVPLGAPFPLTLEQDATVAHALAALNLPARLPQFVTAVNRRVVRPDRKLAPGDELRIQPPLAGGRR